ncbi:MAG: hypothetical protein KQI81_22915 [Deltaproteobacteria bacterium]|nr:hypothetical protein [Deltaproteobacteria bacterium]
MKKEYVRTEVDLHNALIKKGWSILNDYVLLSGRDYKKVGFFGKRHLKKAIKLYHAALNIVPDNYSSKWALGKIYQVLGNHNSSLKWFEEAWILENKNADICREASLAAMNCGDFLKALKFCDKAIELQPDDAGLYCNKALVMMFLNKDAEAIEAVAYSLKLRPNDQITLNLRKILYSMVDGNRTRPKSMKEI